MNDPIDEAKQEARPSNAPTPDQAVNTISKLVAVAVIALIGFIMAAAAYIISHLKQ